LFTNLKKKSRSFVCLRYNLFGILILISEDISKMNKLKEGAIFSFDKSTNLSFLWRKMQQEILHSVCFSLFL
jgi:hypothetical protein